MDKFSSDNSDCKSTCVSETCFSMSDFKIDWSCVKDDCSCDLSALVDYIDNAEDVLSDEVNSVMTWL